MKKKKVIVLGSAGMAGHIITLYLNECGYDVTGFSLFENTVYKGIVGDATDSALIKRIVDEGNFDFIINCIGILNQFAESNHPNAILLNSYLPHYLVKLTENMKTRIIHMSTDCVFSGDRGGYKKDDVRDGQTFYDRTKALGEIEDDKNVTLRNSIVGPDINEKGIGLLNWFMQQENSINGYTRAVWTGQTTLQLAKTMDAVMQNGATGLYNSVPECSITKYELLRLFNHYLRNDALTINPVDGTCLDKSLVSTPFEFGYTIPTYEVMVKEMADWIFAHKELYPHYTL